MRDRRYLLIAIIVAFGALLLWFSAPAHSMGMCGSRADFIKALSDRYQETGKALGIAGQVNLVEVFTSKAGTWTILVTSPQGKTCIIAAGSSWEEMPQKLKENES